jgi:hypothetical protein
MAGPTPVPALEVLVVRSDGCVMLQWPTHDAEASTSRNVPPASDTAPSRLESLLTEARAGKALWQEFRAHDTSLNAALTEALRLHGGRSFQIFEVRSLFDCCSFPTSFSSEHFVF